MIPDTDSDSATSADMFASWPCCSEVIFRRTFPTRRVRYTNSGRNTSEMIASCQSSRHIATSDAITVVAFWAIEVAVVVTTLSRPPMSLAIRDCTSPVRVRVKNASDIRWRCRYTAARRSCITRWPIEFEMYVCQTLSAAFAIAIAIIASTSHVSSVVLCWKIPSSRTSRSRNGCSIPSPAENTISPITAASRQRYGRNSRRIRRRSRSRVGSINGGGFLSGWRVRRIAPVPGVPAAAPIPLPTKLIPLMMTTGNAVSGSWRMSAARGGYR